MNKNEILKKVKKEGLDEREQEIFKNSFGICNIAIVISCLLFSIIEAINGRRFYEFIAIIFINLTVFHFYLYKKLNIRRNLIAAICGIFVVIINLLAYIFVR